MSFGFSEKFKDKADKIVNFYFGVEFQNNHINIYKKGEFVFNVNTTDTERLGIGIFPVTF